MQTLRLATLMPLLKISLALSKKAPRYCTSKIGFCLQKKSFFFSLMELFKIAVVLYKGIFMPYVSKSPASIHPKRAKTVVRSYFLRAATIPNTTTNTMPTKLIRKPRMTDF
jgi:hypothetical protein